MPKVVSPAFPVAAFTLAALLVATVLLTVGSDFARGEKRPRWMSPEAGWVDEETDTRVEKVTRDPRDGSYRVEISVPNVEQPIEEVLVVGTRDAGPEYQLPVRYEVIKELDSGRRGIILYMGSNDDFGLHINYDKGAPQLKDPKDPGLINR